MSAKGAETSWYTSLRITWTCAQAEGVEQSNRINRAGNRQCSADGFDEFDALLSGLSILHTVILIKMASRNLQSETYALGFGR